MSKGLLSLILFLNIGCQVFATDCSRMEQTFQDLQSHFYQPILGKWKHAIWWNFPNFLQSSIDSQALLAKDPKLNDSQKKELLTKNLKLTHSVFYKNKWKYFGGFRNLINDDQMWWALTSIRSYEISGDTHYLQPVWKIFDDTRKTWGKTCASGGVHWKWQNHYVNAINNELFFLLSAKMAQIEKNPARNHTYREYADKEYFWFFQSGMIFDSSQESAYLEKLRKNGIPETSRELFPGLIADGLDTNCKSNFDRPWTYNQGVILAALAEYSKIPDNFNALVATEKARELADASTHSPVLDDFGALGEVKWSQPDVDVEMFKGVYVMDLGVLNETLQDHPYDSFFRKNSDLAWANGRDQESPGKNFGLFNFTWGHWTPWGSGSNQKPSATNQASALALFNSACAVERR